MKYGLKTQILGNDPRFSRVFDASYKKQFGLVNWQQTFDENPIVELDNEIKANITELCDRMSENEKLGSEWLHEYIQIYLLLVYFVFETDENVNHPFVKPLLEYFMFFREQLQKRGEEIPAYFNNNPIDRYNNEESLREQTLLTRQQRKEELRNRPYCPDCGASGYNVRSHGREWHCKLCGRRWQKHYRRKPKNT
jgi:hypothetical protein